MTRPIRGLIEGFYGTPWTWDQRIEVCRFVAARGMTHYVYAPKDDPKHRVRWRDLYSATKVAGFERMIAESGVTVGYAIAPGLDIDCSSRADRKALFVKVDQVVDLGVPLVVLALDDIPFDPAAGAGHAALTTELADHLDGRAEVALIPTEYIGMERTPYLDALARGVPESVPIGWTGPAVVCDAITGEQARRRAEALGGRAPLLWDNYPVNDGLMADRLFMGPLWGRDPVLVDTCSGYLANPMVQARSSLLPLASIAGWLRGDDPLTVWAAEAGPLRVFAEACDGSVPQMLAESLREAGPGPEWAAAAAPVAVWLTAAASCTAPGLDGEVEAWLGQVHREARLGLAALRVLQHGHPYVTVDGAGRGRVVAPQPESVLAEVFDIASRWPKVRRRPVTVMGERCGFRPLLTQAADGGWRMARQSVEEGRNAVDSIVRLALDVLDDLDDPIAPVEVLVEGEVVPVADDGSFTVSPGVEVVTISGNHRTAQRSPCGPPVPAPVIPANHLGVATDQRAEP